MKPVIKGIELTKQEIKALDNAGGIMDQYAATLEYCGVDYDVIQIVENATEIINSIASRCFYDEYVEED